MGIKNEFLPTRNNATPTMDIYQIQRMLYECSESKHNHIKRVCGKCMYFKTKDCKDRLMLDAAHALFLLLSERDKGEALLIEEEKGGASDD